MRTIITGGTGVIGRALASDLARDGHEVVLLSRAPERARGLPAGVRAERWDARTARGWGGLADGAAAIVNLAGESLAAGRWTPERRRAIRDSRMQAGQAVVEALRAVERQPGVLIQSSAVGYYGARVDEELTEATPRGDDFPASVCVAWEASTAAVEQLGVRRAVIRTGIVFSRAGGALPRFLMPFRFFAGGPLGSGRQWHPWIHIADEVAAIRFLMDDTRADGVFNLTAPRPITNAELSHLLGRLLGRPSFVPAPAFALRLAMGDMSTIVLDGQRALPHRLTALGFTFRFPDPESALRDLLGVASKPGAARG